MKLFFYLIKHSGFPFFQGLSPGQINDEGESDKSCHPDEKRLISLSHRPVIDMHTAPPPGRIADIVGLFDRLDKQHPRTTF